MQDARHLDKTKATTQNLIVSRAQRPPGDADCGDSSGVRLLALLRPLVGVEWVLFPAGMGTFKEATKQDGSHEAWKWAR